MKIIRRSFGTQYALLELENGDYYHLPIESLHIPEVGEELTFYEFDFTDGGIGQPVYYTTFRSVLPPQVAGYYMRHAPHYLKEL